MEGGIGLNDDEKKSETEPAMIGLFDSEGHLTPSTLAALCVGSLCDEAALVVLDHLGECPGCAGDYAAVLEQGVLCEPPAGFSERLQAALEEEPLLSVPVDAEQPQIITTSPANTHKGRQSGGSFFAYAFRVAVAACIALIVTFAGFAIPHTNSLTAVKTPDFSIVNAISSNLKAFSQTIVNLEGFNHAKAKK